MRHILFYISNHYNNSKYLKKKLWKVSNCVYLCILMFNKLTRLPFLTKMWVYNIYIYLYIIQYNLHSSWPSSNTKVPKTYIQQKQQSLETLYDIKQTKYTCILISSKDLLSSGVCSHVEAAPKDCLLQVFVHM